MDRTPHRKEGDVDATVSREKTVSHAKSKYRPWSQISASASSVPWSLLVGECLPQTLPDCPRAVFSFWQTLLPNHFRLKGGGQYGEKV